MTVLSLIPLFYFCILFLIQITLIILLLKDKKEKVVLPEPLPFVSILVAVRNEEDNIIECLDALTKLDWPKGKYEVLIGDDSSTDKSFSLISHFIKNKPHFQLFSIRENLGLARGKANVLAHLANAAKGEFFCITDADIQVNPSWVQGLVGTSEKSDGIVSGVTIVKSNNWFSNFQDIDWAYSFGMVRVLANQKVPVSAVGNNMVVSREAYFSTGGYENIPFSTTEDFELFLHTLKNGYTFKNLLQAEVLAYTKPLTTFGQFFKQRRRWITGAVRLPFFPLFVLTVLSLFFPFLIFSFFTLSIVWLLWLIKFSLQTVFIAITLNKMGQMNRFHKVLLYEFVAPPLSFLQGLYYLLPGKVEWKGREYDK